MMKLQLAIDRVTIDRALQIAHAAYPYADIIEIGTSLVKDYGIIAAAGAVGAQFPDCCLLGDIKTVDQGAYEFTQAYNAGCSIATVMGSAAIGTVRACRNTAQSRGLDYMIDLLEISSAQLAELLQFEDAIFCVHMPTDSSGDLLKLLDRLLLPLRPRRIAVAGGITLAMIPALAARGVEIIIVGGSITAAEDIATAAATFHELLKE